MDTTFATRELSTCGRCSCAGASHESARWARGELRPKRGYGQLTVSAMRASPNCARDWPRAPRALCLSPQNAARRMPPRHIRRRKTVLSYRQPRSATIVRHATTELPPRHLHGRSSGERPRRAQRPQSSLHRQPEAAVSAFPALKALLFCTNCPCQPAACQGQVIIIHISKLSLNSVRSQSRRCAQGWTSTWRWLT